MLNFLGMKLYYWTTTNAHKVTIFFEEVGLDYELIPINISKGEQFEKNFLKLSPNNKIPALLDENPDPKMGVSRIELFESGAILEYLADKTGQFLAPVGHAQRYAVLKWLYWQMASLGPMLGQNHHFRVYAPEKIPYAMERYLKETHRLYTVLNLQLKNNPYVAGEVYSIADMAVYPWIVPHERQGMDLNEFPTLQKWFQNIAERPAVQLAYEKAKRVNTESTVSEESKKILFGQDGTRLG